MSLREAWNLKKETIAITSGCHCGFRFRGGFTVRAQAGRQILYEKKVCADSARQAEIDGTEPAEAAKTVQIQGRFFIN